MHRDDAAPGPMAEPDHAMLLAVYTQAVDGIILADADTGLLLHLNPAAGRLIGRDPREMVGRHQTELHPPAESEYYTALFANKVSAAAQRLTFVEALVRHADGRDIPVSITMSLYQRNGRRILQGFFRDLSGQQTTMRALDHERAHLAALIRTIPDLVWLKDPVGRYLACNPAFERLYGLPESKLIGRTDYDFVDAATAEFFLDHDRRAMESGQPTRNEEWLTFQADGYRGLFETIKTPMRDGKGGLLGVLGVARDITEVRRAQGHLRNSRDDELAEARQLRNVVSGLETERDLFIAGPLVAFRWRNETDWPVEYVSANVDGLLGYQAHDFLSGSTTYASLIHPDDAARVGQEVTDAGAGPAAFFEHRPYRLRHRDGRYLWLHDFTRILRDADGRPTHYFGYVLDISERIGMQEHLRAESDFREALIESATEGICAGYICNEPPYVRMTVWNRRMRELTGYTQYEINRSVWYQSLFPGTADRERVIARANQARAGEQLYGEEWVITMRDGQRRTLRVSTAAIPGPGPEGRSSMLAVMEDVTERRRLEDALRQAQRLEALGTLVGGIAHDFNNFLAGMLGNLELAHKSLGNATQDATAITDVQARLTAVQQLGSQAAEMIARLLAFGGRDRAQPEPLDLTGFVNAALARSRAALPEGCRIEADIPVDPLMIAGDASQLQQVFMNLLINAGDALRGSPEPRLDISLRRARLEPDFRRAHGDLPDGPYARLTIADNGPGIAPADLARVFEPFFTTKPVGQGCGLGLPMVYGIIAGHGGCVHIESEPGLGTAIIAHLPLTDVAPAPPPGPPAPVEAVPRGNGELILVADDEPFMRNLVRELLTSLGYRTLQTVDGAEAVAALQKHGAEVAAALLDVSMPRVSGPEAARMMRAARPDLPVVFMTGYDRESALGTSTEAQAEIVLGKPFRLSTLAQTMRDALRNAAN